MNNQNLSEFDRFGQGQHNRCGGSNQRCGTFGTRQCSTICYIESMSSESYPLRIDSKQFRKLQKQAESENRTVASLIRHAIACYLADKAAEVGKAVSA